MKLNELLERVNQKIIDYKLNEKENQMYYDDCSYKVGSLIKEVFKEEGIEANFSVYPQKSEVQLHFNDYRADLYLKIRRKKGDPVNQWWRSNTQYYIDRVEWPWEDEEYYNQTFEELFNHWIDQQLKAEQSKIVKVNEIVETIENAGFTFEEFESFEYYFNKYRYDVKEKMTGNRW